MSKTVEKHKPETRRKGERDVRFTTISDMPVEPLYGPGDPPDFTPDRDLGQPGQYPFTRGIHENMYRGRVWTMRQFAGFGTATDTNNRYKYLLEHGTTGLSVAFDLPTLMGVDSNHPLALGEVGKEGVAIDTLADMETLFADIPLDQVSTSMTINAPASVIFAMYLAVAEKQGASRNSLRGTLQNDIFKEYIAQKEWIYPPRPHLRLITDLLGFCCDQVPQWNTISISGYHIREAGSTAVQELAFTLADGIGYVQAGIDAGLDMEVFAPRLSFFFNAHNDFFEEIAKLRAARRIWARIMRERFAAKDPRAWKLRMHVQTAGCSLTAQQPVNNVARVTMQALAAVLGGTQSLHTNSMDETLCLPTEHAVRVALRTQQIIAEESGVTNTVDPLGGSYFVESLTSRIEGEAMAYIRQIDEMGGIINAIEANYPQKEIAEASFHYQQQLDSHEKVMIGVNSHTAGDDSRPEVLTIGPEVEEEQLRRLNEIRHKRDQVALDRTLVNLQTAARGEDNTMPHILEAVRAYGTVGEISDALKEVFGSYQETSVF
ncbi:MAG: methylmalonyl-CoA mutase family protein [Acidobacteria bacterium]|nr:methylmalonyl-CoA mutase family protein [Acidobacteriota bacterium]